MDSVGCRIDLMPRYGAMRGLYLTEAIIQSGAVEMTAPPNSTIGRRLK